MVHRPAATSPATAQARSLSLRLSPLVAALAAALPLLSHAPVQAQAVVRPVAAAVPVPSVSWRVSGTGGAAPVNKPNAAGGVDQTVSQTSTRGIYQWNSFDIGDKSSVTFEMAQKGASALNRIGGSAPSQIFGKLSATNGGEIFLINANGILFGKGAQVNTGSLVASALNIADSEYLSGFAQSLTNASNADLNAAFRYDGTPENFVDAKSFVRVDEGAAIATLNGGRVFLFAKRVDNAGSISTPGGQTVLAGGGEVYLKLPTSEDKLYASETNPAVSALRGFLVEVGAGPATAPEGSGGSAGNGATGVIATARGNTTLVGMAVNQLGRINATTSVSENGSVILRAQGGAGFDANSQTVRATTSGALTLGAGSRIDIAADTTPDAAGKPRTTADSVGFATSHIDLAGQTVLLGDGAAIVAPGATVNVRAETVPTYFATLQGDPASQLGAGDTAARIVLGRDTLIDVAGTTNTVESVARHFVTTELLGSNDLKDAPEQKDGLLYRAKVTVDTRDDSLVLGSLDKYRDGIARTVDERLSTGGQVNLRAEGAVVTQAGSRIDVSGGQVRYTEAQVKATQLLGADGKTYTLNDAPVDGVFVSATNLQKSSLASYDRWGVQLAFGSVTPGQLEQGYVQGSGAGSLAIAAPTLVLQGGLKGGSLQGERQLSGQDARAAGGALSLGAVVNGGLDFANKDYLDAVLGNFSVSAKGPHPTRLLGSEPLTAVLPGQSGIAAATLQDSGFSDVAIAANGAVEYDSGAAGAYQMADGGSLRLLSVADAVTLGSDLRGAHASVELNSKQTTATPPGGSGPKSTGAVTVADGVSVDLSGVWVNAALRPTPLDTSAIAGGRFTAAGYGVSLGAGSLVDVSGGASVSQAGVVSGAAAGSIALLDQTLADAPAGDTLLLGGELRGHSAQASNGVASGGGSLSLQTRRVLIADQPAAVAPGTLALSSDFFDRGGFGSFSIDGRLALDVAAGSTVAPQRETWQAPASLPGAVLPPSGTPAREVLQPGLAPGLRAGPVNLALASSGDANQLEQGVLTVGAGATLRPGAQATVALSAAHQIIFDGRIASQGGTVSARLKGSSLNEPNVLWLGAGSEIDVSGALLATPGLTDGSLRGTVVDGGRITLDAGNASSLVFQAGARLAAAGASGVLDVTERSDGGLQTSRRTVSSAGGSVAFAGNSDLWLEGTVDLHGGAPTAAGGQLAVTLRNGVTDANAPALDTRELRLTQRASGDSAALTPAGLAAPAAVSGRSEVAADWLAASGAADVTLASTDTLRLAGSVQLAVDRQLTLVARGLSADAGSSSQLSASTVFVGWNAADVGGIDPNRLPAAPSASTGDAGLQISARDGMVLDGKLVTQGLGTLGLHSGGDLRLQSRDAVATGSSTSGLYTGSLTTPAALTISAAQIYPASDNRYTLDADSVAFTGGDAATAKPLSAGGQLVVNATTIVQDGVLRAPLGHIELHASETLSLDAGSETSVSAAGQTLLYGQSAAGVWTRPDGSVLQTPPDKQIVLDSRSVSTLAGSTLDATGGGDLVATEFVPGAGGSTDILAAPGSYAIVPALGRGSLPAADPGNLGGTGAAQALGRQIEIGAAVRLADGTLLPPGLYTLQPARYAMLPGAFLVRPAAASGSALSLGTSVARTDGSVLIGARLRDAGSAASATLASTWQVMDKTTLLRYSEIRESHAGEVFAARAAKAGLAAPQLPNDAGSVVVKTEQARLEGRGLFSAASDAQGKPLGQGGRAEFVADNIQVDAGNGVAADGVLHLSATTLNQLGAQTVVLGASSAAAGSTAQAGAAVPPRSLQTQAGSVVFAQGAQALTVPDLVASATGSIVVGDNAVFAPAAGSVLSSAPASYTLLGDGAALRVAVAPGAAMSRSEVAREAGSLQVGAGVQFNAAGGSLVLDSTGGTAVAADARLAAADITLAGSLVRVGAESSRPDQLSLTAALTRQVSAADSLTLRGYRSIAVVGGSTLGNPALAHLVLDTPSLQTGGLNGLASSIVAGDLTLGNSTGNIGKGTAPATGSGQLTLQASSAAGGSGVLHIASGTVAFDGAATLALQADTAVSLAGDAGLRAPGNVTLAAPALVAETPAAELALSAGGLLRIAPGASGAVSPTTVSVDGAVFSATADAIEMAGNIVLPSGQVSLAGTRGVQMLDGARVVAAGRSVKMDTQTVDLAGGDVSLASSAGNVAIAADVRIDVSGGGATGAGGSLALSAAAGEVQLGGTLLGASGASAAGATLAIDAGRALAVSRVAAKTAGGQFTGAISLRQREGDLGVGPAVTLAAHEIGLQADGGALAVRGTLDAHGAVGGRITLSARDDVALSANARLLANAQTAGADGGRLEIESAQGRLQFAAGSLIDLRAAAATADGAQADGGRLTLRARQVGPHDVAIAALDGDIVGAERVDVQAVQVYDGITRIENTGHTNGRLATERVARDAMDFVGSRGEFADAMVERLAAGDTALADRMKVHHEAEVRSQGDLTVATDADWALPQESLDVTFTGGSGQHVGNSSVTLRAAGDLLVRQGISSGFDFFGGPGDGAGGNIRLVAGADLSAASALSTGAQAHEASLGYAAARGPKDQLLVRSTTGDLAVAASGDIDLFTGRAALYTSGRPADEAALLAGQALGVNGFTGMAFNTGGGEVSLVAGGSVRSRETYTRGVSNSQVMGLGNLALQAQVASFDGSSVATGWWSDRDGLQRGIASFGGGDIRVQAGVDVVNLVAYAPGSGYSETATATGEGAAAAPVTRQFAGGSVKVAAGRDIVNGLYAAGGATLRVSAGRDIARRVPDNPDFPGLPTPGTRLYYENTAIQADARRDLTLGSAQSRFLHDTWLTGLDRNASLGAVAAAGSLSLSAGSLELDPEVVLLPGRVSLAAPSGDVAIGNAADAVSLVQMPQADGRLVVLAGGNLTTSAPLLVNATRTSEAALSFYDGFALDALRLSNTPVLADGSGLDQSSREPVQLVALQGDLTVGEQLASARPVRLVAGRDLVLANANAIVRAQHQPGADGAASRELSLLQAGRDILFGSGVLRIGGGGDGVLLAGRDVDLGRAGGVNLSEADGSGLMAIGNTENGLLPAQSASLTVVAGLRADGADYGAAVGQGFHALGSAALAARAGDVYALLSATDHSVPALGTATALQFDALDTAAQLAQVEALLGTAVYDQALAGYVRGLQGNSGLSDAQALAAFASQSQARQDAAPGSLLAAQLASEPSAQRVAFIAQVAAADTPRTALGLQAWMQAKLGQTLGLAEAVSAFEALPLERQVSWLNQVLVDEVRAQGRAAAQASGFEAEAAYLRGYQAINTVFAVDRPGGEIRLPTTQIKTLQQANTELLAATDKDRAVTLGAVTLMAPGGGVNAGELGSTSQRPNNLGIVTAAGGDIAGIVRDDFLVNQSRVFSLAEGDILLWSSSGDINAGKGAKTVSGAPAPVLRLDPASGKLVLDTSGSFTGSGIAVLNAASDLDLYAPAGAIDAGEAGIRAQGNVFLGAQVVRGADNLQFGGAVVGAPVATAAVSATAGLASAANALAQAGSETDDDEQRRKRRLARRNLLLEFLGFGRG